ncbi:MAG: hypothetical protein M3Q45_15150 [Chloroflexota bacterium]|nr:hypothetical protein [Chloroflexota bacterium]
MAQAEMTPPVWVNRQHPQPARKAPPSEVGALGWLRANLFSGVGNTILTLITAAALYFLVPSLVRWVLGATWEPVWANRKLLAVGGYPSERLMQPMLILMVLSFLFGVSGGRWGSIVRNVAIGLGGILLLWALLPAGAWVQMRMGLCLALLLIGYGIGRFVPLPDR